MPPLRSIILQDDFSLGMWRDVAPHRVDSRACYDHINGLYDEDGSPYKRGGARAITKHPYGGTVQRTNLAINPRAEAGTTGWTGTAYLSVVDVPTQLGLPLGVEKCFRFDTSADPAATGSRFAFPVEQGKDYTVALYGMGEQFGWGSAFEIRDENDALVTWADMGGLGSGEFARLTATFTAQATDDYEIVLPATVTIFYFTALLIEEGENAGFYFDGDSPLSRWMGTPHESPSEYVQGAQGLKFVWDGYFAAGRRTLVASPAGFAVLADDEETLIDLGGDGLDGPAPAALLRDMLFIGGGYIYAGSRAEQPYSTGTVAVTEGSATVTGTGTSWEDNVDAGMLFQVGNGRVYVVASVDSNTQLTLTEPYEGATASGQSYTLHNVYKVTSADPYVDAPFYTVVANRLVTARDNRVLFSEVLKPHKWTVTIEEQEIPNEHELPLGTLILGAAAIQQTALIFTTRGIWTIDGLAFDLVDAVGTPQHRVALLAPDQILHSQVGIAGWQQTLLVPCTDGVYLLDGLSAPHRVSHPIDELYRGYVERGYRFGSATVYRGHYLLPVLGQGGVVRDVLVCRLDHPVEYRGQAVRPWSRFGGSGADVTGYAVRITGSDGPLLLGADASTNALVLDCSRYFELDESCMTDQDGTVPEWVLTTRDFETGSGLKNAVRALFTRYELKGVGSQIEFAYGFGLRREWAYAWDEWNWADEVDEEPEDLIFVDDDEDIYHDLNCPAGESEGIDRHRCRINEHARFIRFRLRSRDACSLLKLRSIEIAVRPSRATRR